MDFERGVPVKLENDAIIECILEMRYESQLPSDVVFGIIYQGLSSVISPCKVSKLPILNIPPDIREKDPALRNQPWWEIYKGIIKVGISPCMISFSVRKPYCGWSFFFSEVTSCLDPIIESKAIQRASRIGLRYINVFDDSLFTITGLKLSTESEELVDSLPLQISFLEKNQSLSLACNLCNRVTVSIDNAKYSKTIIDIDSFTDQIQTISMLKKDYRSIIENLHRLEKEKFFKLLTAEYTKKCKPIYTER